jgi:siderophore synthetase component
MIFGILSGISGEKVYTEQAQYCGCLQVIRKAKTKYILKAACSYALAHCLHRPTLPLELLKQTMFTSCDQRTNHTTIFHTMDIWAAE